MGAVPRGKIVRIGFAYGCVEGSDVSAQQAKLIRRYIRNTVAYLATYNDDKYHPEDQRHQNDIWRGVITALGLSTGAAVALGEDEK